MSTGKLSATVPEALLAEVREHVGRRGLSAFVTRALQHELDRVALRSFLDELAEEIGQPDPQMVAEAEAMLDELLAPSKSGKRRRAPAA
jgi:hypothetical protein